LLVAAWGWFLYHGVTDPLGGINTLWPLFGLANQLLSVIALCLGTTLLIKMKKARYIWVTLVPLLFMTAVTFSAGYMKIFSSDPKLGFISGAHALLSTGNGIASASKAADLARQVAVWRFDAFVAASFLLLVLLIVIGSALEWYRLLVGTKSVQLHEAKFVSLAEVARST
jgi:carbon starvation protein